MGPRENGRHFADVCFFRCVFLNEDIWISINISLKFVLKVQINDMIIFSSDNGLAPTRRQASIWTNYCMYWRIHPSLGFNELNKCSPQTSYYPAYLPLRSSAQQLSVAHYDVMPWKDTLFLLLDASGIPAQKNSNAEIWWFRCCYSR